MEKFKYTGLKNLRSLIIITVLLMGVVMATFLKGEKKAVEASLFNGEKSFEASTEADLTVNIKNKKLVPLGTAFGIKLYTDGVIVTALQNIESGNVSFSPAKNAGIMAGDYIIEAEGEIIDSNEELSGIIKSQEDGEIKLKVRRGSEYFDTDLKLITDNGVKMAGMWIRDSAAGIGTLTYYDEETGQFAGLGHGICDMDVGSVMEIKSGQPEEIVISDIDKAEKGLPGRLKGYFSGTGAIGELNINSETGIYGTLYEKAEGEALSLASKEEIVKGEAEIICTIDSSGPQRYKIEITEIFNDDRNIKNMVIKVTDEYLLNKTGGIIQGLSGSPIVQNGKLIGAVTHVFVDDPSMGYGIFIENMLKE